MYTLKLILYKLINKWGCNALYDLNLNIIKDTLLHSFQRLNPLQLQEDL